MNLPRARALLILGGALLLAGCSCGPYKDALRRVGEVGPRIEADIKPTSEGGQARKEAFHDLVIECQRLGGE